MAAPARRRARIRAEPVSWKCEGNLEGCTRDGSVTGWCWYPQDPHTHVTLSVLVNGALVGAAHAILFRPDLLAAGIGDGTHGFTFALPWSALDDTGLVTIAVRCDRSGELLGQPIRLRLGPSSNAENRVAEMERQVRQLRGEIAVLAAALDRSARTQPMQDVFAALGHVFAGLAEGAPVLGDTLPDLKLRQAVQALQTERPPFDLAVPSSPIAMLVIPAGRDLDQLYRCLVWLHRTGLDIQADIVVLDDGQAPPELALWPSVIGQLRIINGHPTGPAWLDLARTDRTGIIAVLAPPMRPEPGWLTTLAATLSREPGAALVLGAAIGENDLLRHAGLAADAEGYPQPHAELAPANAPENRHLREIEATGATGFAITRAAFLACGGLQPGLALGHAALALSLRVRHAGHRLLFQPHATARCDDDADLSAYIPDLMLDDADTGAVLPAWRSRPPAPAPIGHALVIDTHLPRPDQDAGSVATVDHLMLLRRLGYHVALATSGEVIDETDPAAHALERAGVQLVRSPATATDHLLRHGPGLDLVLVWRHANATLFHQRIRTLAPRARLIFAPADLHHLRERRHAALRGSTRRQSAPGALQIETEELHAINAADATLLHSDAEIDLLRSAGSTARLRLLRWIVEPQATRPAFAERHGIGFVGNFRHGPNEDGLRWFVSHVMPRVLAARPDIILHVAGADLPPPLARLLAAQPQVVVDGWVEDLGSWFARLRLTVAPLRYGAGFKGKVATSLSFGVPIAGTTMAIEGTGLMDGDGIAIADGPAGLASQILQLHNDEDLWQDQSDRALERCRALYAPEAALEIYRAMLTELGLPTSKEAVLL